MSYCHNHYSANRFSRGGRPFTVAATQANSNQPAYPDTGRHTTHTQTQHGGAGGTEREMGRGCDMGSNHRNTHGQEQPKRLVELDSSLDGCDTEEVYIYPHAPLSPDARARIERKLRDIERDVWLGRI